MNSNPLKWTLTLLFPLVTAIATTTSASAAQPAAPGVRENAKPGQ